ncbi:MAG TPA: hypothetical protein VGJ86_02365 [Acidimicrobiales bacterium]
MGLALAVGCARIGLTLERRLRTAPPAPPAEVPVERMELAPGELATWTGTAAANGGLRLGLIAFPAFLSIWFSDERILTIGSVCLVLAALGSVRVSVGAHGVRVRPELVRWPAVRIPLAHIARAEAIDLHPMRWGGWGYRGSLRLVRRAAWVVRGGPGLRIELTDGAVFAVTVDNAVAVLNGLLAAEAPTAA